MTSIPLKLSCRIGGNNRSDNSSHRSKETSKQSNEYSAGNLLVSLVVAKSGFQWNVESNQGIILVLVLLRFEIG